MDPVSDEKASVYGEGFSYEDYCKIVESSPGFSFELCCEVVGNYPRLVKEHNRLLKKDNVSQNVIEKVRLENKDLCEKLEGAKKSKEEFEEAIAKLKVKTNNQEKMINGLNSDVNRPSREINQSLEKHQSISSKLKAEKAGLKIEIENGAKERLEANKRCMEHKDQLAKANKMLELKSEDNKKLQIEVNVLKEKVVELEKKSEIELYDHLSVKMHSLETKLKQQEEFTCAADVQSYMDQLREANDRIITDLKIQHCLEKDVIRIDLKNKAKVFVALQKEVQHLKEANRLLEGIVRSVLEEDRMILKNASRKGPQVEHLKYFTPELQEFLKKIALRNEKRRNGEDPDDDFECADSKGSGAASTSK